MNKDKLIMLVGILINVACLAIVFIMTGQTKKHLDQLYKAHTNDIMIMTKQYSLILTEYKIVITALAAKQHVDIPATIKSYLEQEKAKMEKEAQK